MVRVSEVAVVHRDVIPGSPARYDEDAVSAVYEMLEQGVRLAGGIDPVINPGDRVLLKVNACWPVPADSGITSDPRVVAAVVRYLKKVARAGSVTVAERSSIKADSLESLQRSGVYDAALREGADRIVPLERDVRLSATIPGAKVLRGEVHLPQCVVQADKIVYLAKMKTHKVCGITASMKLSQGILPWSEQIKYHRNDIDQKIVDLLRLVRPDLSIVDALWPMQGQGPGSPYKDDLIKDFNTIVVGRDPVAVDSVCARLMGFDPMFEVAYIRDATVAGLGEGRPERIDVMGEDIERIKRNFRRGDIGLIGLHPKIDVYVSGSCKGCCHFTRTGLDPWLADQEKLKDFDKVEKITLIIGKDNPLGIRTDHKPPKSYTFVIGDCASQHRDKGIFLPGCPSLSLHGLMPFIGLSDEEILAKYARRLPEGFVP